jgi:hypothetical protein
MSARGIPITHRSTGPLSKSELNATTSAPEGTNKHSGNSAVLLDLVRLLARQAAADALRSEQ